MSVLITGTSRILGQAVARRFTAFGLSAVLGTRTPTAALAAVGVEDADVRHLDFAAPSSFSGAPHGITEVLLIAPLAKARSDQRLKPFLEAALAHGVEHFVVNSALVATVSETFVLRRLERLVESTGRGWTHLRSQWYMSTPTRGLFAPMLRQGQYLLPVGPRDEIAYVAVQDVAEVAALVLAAPEQHVGKLHELTGSASLDGPTVAATRPSASGESSPRAPDAGGTAVSTAILRPLTIDVDAPLVLTEVERVVTGPVEVVLGAGVCERVATCHEFALRRIQDGRPVYGATTGFGPLVGFDGVARLSALTASAHENPQRLVELWADAIAG